MYDEIDINDQDYDLEDELMHYGTPRHSGRYPWGSGEDPYQRNESFMRQIKDMKAEGMSEKDIAAGLGLSTTQLRSKISIAKNENRKADMYEVARLKEKGMSNMEIARRMGKNESSIRSLLNTSSAVKTTQIENTGEKLKEAVDKKGYIDVGVGTERFLGISRTKLNATVDMLKEEGYTVHYLQVDQLGTGNKTSLKVLAAPGTPFSEVYANRANIRMTQDFYTEDGGMTWSNIRPPECVDRKRVMVRYNEDGGLEKDGVIEVRRGCKDLDMGASNYAQVRILMNTDKGEKAYMKGMCVYSDDMPDGVDIIFNSNRHKGAPDLSSDPKIEGVFKKMKSDPDNPFGATINRQSGALNIVNEEGDWGKWSKSLSSQMLSKQMPSLAKKQLAKAYDAKKDEYDEIMTLNNPVIKKKLLESFSDDCDAAAVHLKAAALPRQAAQVMLPCNSLKEGEIYAPNFRDGEKVVLIRYPHGGKFEIPELTVNNKNAEGRRVIGEHAKDAIGVTPKTREQLSGADCDGDTALVIPNNNGVIKTMKPLAGLKNFDPSSMYPPYDGMPKTGPDTGFHKGLEMGKVSNLITDMTIKGASSEELARAVRHSMVVIDAEKHNLNWRQSYIDNNIADLKARYQGGVNKGASTIISRASAETRVLDRKDGVQVTDPITGKTKTQYIDPKTGEKLYTYTGETYTNKKGQEVQRTNVSTKMYEVKDAHELSSGYEMENIYADHANKLKALANESRKSLIAVQDPVVNKEAKVKYAAEVESLNAKLNVALQNAPKERQAQIIANAVVREKKLANPDMNFADVKKISGQALTQARLRVGAKKQNIDISDKEWEAIQAGAISKTKLTQIINNSDLDKVKQLATPRDKVVVPRAKEQRALNMAKNGYTTSEIADALGVSTSTISSIIREL